jgi:hypothetical protein
MEKTPEARLLELIKGGGRPRLTNRLRIISERFLAVAARLKISTSGLSPWQLSNRALLVVFLFLSAGALRSWFARPVVVPDGSVSAVETESADETPLGASGATLKELTSRNLFHSLVQSSAPSAAPKPAAPALAPPPPRLPLSQRAGYLRLTGIIAGDTLQAVIEDKKKNTSRYVSAGDDLDEFHVEKVLPDRVIISSDGETLDLTL